MIAQLVKCSALPIQEHQRNMKIESEAQVVENPHEPAPPDI